MIRDPITRLDSLFYRACEANGAVNMPPDDIYRPFRETQGDLEDIGSDEPASRSPLGVHARQFDALCNNVLAEDAFILKGMDRRDIFKYEEIARDPEYFRGCFESLAEGCRRAMAISPARHGTLRLECSQQYLDRVFETGSIKNVTSRVRLTKSLRVGQTPSR